MGALTQFACTACGKVLKSPKPIEEGKRIKCPHCQQVFAVGNGAPVRRSGGDLTPSSTPRRPTTTRPEKRKRSSGLAMWGTCFIVSLILSTLLAIPAHFAISGAMSVSSEVDKARERNQEMQKELEKKLNEYDKSAKDAGKADKDKE